MRPGVVCEGVVVSRLQGRTDGSWEGSPTGRWICGSKNSNHSHMRQLAEHARGTAGSLCDPLSMGIWSRGTGCPSHLLQESQPLLLNERMHHRLQLLHGCFIAHYTL